MTGADGDEKRRAEVLLFVEQPRQTGCPFGRGDSDPNPALPGASGGWEVSGPDRALPGASGSWRYVFSFVFHTATCGPKGHGSGKPLPSRTAANVLTPF